MYSADPQVASWCYTESSAMVSVAYRLDIQCLWQVAAHTIYWPMQNLYFCHHHGNFFYVSILSTLGWLMTSQFSFV